MYTAFDEYLIHQTSATVDHVADGDPRFQERVFFNAHGRPGPSLSLGIGSFPNANVMQGYVEFVDGQWRRTLRLARVLQHDRERLSIGPLDIHVVVPLREWQLVLGDNPSGLTFDLRFQATTVPVLHPLVSSRTEEGLVAIHQQHMQQSGRYGGPIEIDATAATHLELWGSRDRSWGVRGPTRDGRGSGVDLGFWMAIQFESHVLHAWLRPMACDGSGDGEDKVAGGGISTRNVAEPPLPIRSWRTEGAGGSTERGTTCFVLTMADGSVERVRLTRVAASRDLGRAHLPSPVDPEFVAVDLVEGEVTAAEHPVLSPDQMTEYLVEMVHAGEEGYGVLLTRHGDELGDGQ
jgi:hypothetical protein